MTKTLNTVLAALSVLAVYAKTSTPEGWMDDYDAALADSQKAEKLAPGVFAATCIPVMVKFCKVFIVKE